MVGRPQAQLNAAFAAQLSAVMLALLGHWDALCAAAAAKEVQEQRFKAENCRNQGGGRDRIIVTDNYSTTAPPAHKTALKSQTMGL